MSIQMLNLAGENVRYNLLNYVKKQKLCVILRRMNGCVPSHLFEQTYRHV